MSLLNIHHMSHENLLIFLDRYMWIELERNSVRKILTDVANVAVVKFRGICFGAGLFKRKSATGLLGKLLQNNKPRSAKLT